MFQNLDRTNAGSHAWMLAPIADPALAEHAGHLPRVTARSAPGKEHELERINPLMATRLPKKGIRGVQLLRLSPPTRRKGPPQFGTQTCVRGGVQTWDG